MNGSYPDLAQFERTELQRHSPRAAWERSDEAFFAAGACGILAYVYHWRHPDWRIMWIDAPKTHLYCRKGHTVFDFAGYHSESELFNEWYKYNGETFVATDVTDMRIEDLYQRNGWRGPEYFYQLPWERAERYVDDHE